MVVSEQALTSALFSLTIAVFVILQRRNFYQCPFRIGPMDGLAVVPQSLLRESFRHACHLCPLGPSVAVTVQGDTLDAQKAAASAELGGTVSGVGCGDGWKQWPLGGELVQDGIQFPTDGHLRLLASFHPKIGQRLRWPVNIFMR